jgi:Subtilase family
MPHFSLVDWSTSKTKAHNFLPTTRMKLASLAFILSLLLEKAASRLGHNNLSDIVEELRGANPRPFRKLSDHLDELDGEVHVIVKYKNKPDGEGNLAGPLVYKSKVENMLTTAAIVRKEDLKALEDDANVEYVELDEILFRFGDVVPYGIRQTQGGGLNSIPNATSYSSSCSNPDSFKVAIIDDGLDVNHPDIGCGNITDDSTTRCMGKSFSSSTYSIEGPHWYAPIEAHGTHVAGIIGALGTNDFGITGMIAGKLKILCHRGRFVKGSRLTCQRSSNTRRWRDLLRHRASF